MTHASRYSDGGRCCGTTVAASTSGVRLQAAVVMVVYRSQEISSVGLQVAQEPCGFSFFQDLTGAGIGALAEQGFSFRLPTH